MAGTAITAKIGSESLQNKNCYYSEWCLAVLKDSEHILAVLAVPAMALNGLRAYFVLAVPAMFLKGLKSLFQLL